MTLEKHISALVKTNDMVIIPSFGGLVAHACEALITGSENVITSPSKSFSFNPKLSYQDGLLVQSYMKEHNLSQNEALIEVNIAIDNFRKRLNSLQKIEISEVGNFIVTEEGVILFNQTKQDIRTPEMFGLEKIYLQKLPSKKEILQPDVKIIKAKHINTQQIAKWISVAAVFLVMLLISKPVSDEGLTLNMAGPSFDFGALTSEAQVSEKIVQTAIELKSITLNVIDSTEIKRAVAIALDEVLNYNVIVSSITNKRHAQAKLNYFKESGFKSAKIIENSGRYRISIGTFATKDEGLKRLSQIRNFSSRYKDAWILKTANI